MRRPHVVIVGNGMAGAKVAELIRARDPQRMFALTIVGDEVHETYNRVLLTDVLAGRHALDDIRLRAVDPQTDGTIEVCLGDAVVAIDRSRRQVHTLAGRCFDYDIVVLATGSRPNAPAVDGLYRADGELVPGGFFLRTVDDCREILAASKSAHRVAVLGGGLLGVEVAHALAAGTANVVIVHSAGHVLDRQLDEAAGAVLARALRREGIGVQLHARATRLIADDRGHVGGVGFADGSYLLADLLVVAAGTTPRVDLARECGLTVDIGIVTGATMQSIDDPLIFAVGDCAQYDGQVYGVVSAAWEHARVAADHITGADPAARFRGAAAATRLKAGTLTVAAMGAAQPTEPDDEVVMVTDTARGLYRKVVVRNGKLHGAVVVGPLSTLGTLSQLHERNAMLPSDRLSLIAPAVAAAAPVNSPALMPAGTTVCNCNGVSKGAIQKAVLAGSRSVAAVAQTTRATTGCGGCADVVAGLVDWLVAADADADDQPDVVGPTGHPRELTRADA
jgi:assimilatory nitrate reductase electron transfer subunit